MSGNNDSEGSGYSGIVYAHVHSLWYGSEPKFVVVVEKNGKQSGNVVIPEQKLVKPIEEFIDGLVSELLASSKEAINPNRPFSEPTKDCRVVSVSQSHMPLSSLKEAISKANTPNR